MECSMLEFSILVSLIQIYFIIISHITYLLYTLFHTVKYCRIVLVFLSISLCRSDRRSLPWCLHIRRCPGTCRRRTVSQSAGFQPNKDNCGFPPTIYHTFTLWVWSSLFGSPKRSRDTRQPF